MIKQRLGFEESVRLAGKVEQWKAFQYTPWTEEIIGVRGEVSGLEVTMNKDYPMFRRLRKNKIPKFRIRVEGVKGHVNIAGHDSAVNGRLYDSLKQAYEEAVKTIRNDDENVCQEYVGVARRLIGGDE